MKARWSEAWLPRCCLLSVAILCLAAPGHAADQPNVLVIVVETFRADHAGFMGYGRDTTPAIDQLASEGVLFTNCHTTCSWTTPSHASLFTSLYPGVHGCVKWKGKLPDACTTMAEALQKNGYSTVGFVSNPHIAAVQGFAQGFDLYDDFTVFLDVELNLFEEQDAEHVSAKFAESSDKVTELATNWLRRNKDKQFFMFLHYFDPHYDYMPPKPYNVMFDTDYTGKENGRNIAGRKDIVPGMKAADLKHLVALYDGELRYTDCFLGKLFDEMQKLGVKDRTIIVVTSDHGEEFLEHGGKTHGRTLFEEVLHVPLVIRYPPLASKGLRRGDLVSLVDVLPTVLDMADISADFPMQGRSLRRIMTGTGGQLPSTSIYAELDMKSHIECVLWNNFKYVLSEEGNARMLFDLKVDPEEKRNLLTDRVDVAKQLGEKLRGWREASAHLRKLYDLKDGEEAKFDEHTLRRLKSLGYLP